MFNDRDAVHIKNQSQQRKKKQKQKMFIKELQLYILMRRTFLVF